MTQRVLVVSDLHVGSTVAPWPVGATLEDGGEYAPNEYQLWLNTCWQDLVDSAGSLDKPVLVLNGDITQGASPRDGQLVSPNVSIQLAAAVKLLKPLVDLCGSVYYVRGTEWHEGKSSEHCELLAQMLGCEQHSKTHQYTRWELRLELGGKVIHFAHHVQGSSVPWYEATVPLRDTLLHLSELWRFYGKDAPNVRMVVRSHRHRYIYVDAPPDIQVVVTPGWQLPTAFAYKRAGSMLPQIGYVLIETEEDALRVRRKIYPLLPLHVEVL